MYCVVHIRPQTVKYYLLTYFTWILRHGESMRTKRVSVSERDEKISDTTAFTRLGYVYIQS